MAGVLDAVDQRTKLVGQNRLELLLFKLNGKQLYGINVFKVKEVLPCRKLTEIPQRNHVVRGIAHIRGVTISVMDMNLAMGNSPLENIEQCFIIIAEYNMAVQGFLVSAVERIVNLNWENIHPPPKGAGRGNYLTAVTDVDNQIVEIIDVEKILSQVAPASEEITETILEHDVVSQAKETKLSVLVVDDSSVARNQIKRCLEKLGIETHLENDGRAALDHLKSIVDQGEKITDRYMMLISDIEMPEMDGYTLTTLVRENPNMQDLYILLHTSLSGVFNESMVQRVGANEFLAKFKPDLLAELVQSRAKQSLQNRSD